MPPKAKLTKDTSTANLGVEASCASLQSTATLRSLSKAKDNRFLPIYQFADEANKKITHLDDFAATFLVKCTLGTSISRTMVIIAKNGNASAKQLAFKTADVQNHSAMATIHSNFQLN